MKRRNRLACSMALDPDFSSRQELKGDVYNIFPFIRDPDPEKRAFPMDRAFTFPSIIDCIFFPRTHEYELQRISSYVNHEMGHFILGSAMVTCEERALAAKLLGMVCNFLIDADDGVQLGQLLIPSFTIVGPAGKVLELHKLADQLDKLADAREAVHEIVACVMQVGGKYWDRDKARRLIRQVVADTLLDEKALDGFLDVYENLGPMAACSIGHYALNVVGLTKRTALARFKRATKVARTFKPKDRQDTGPLARQVGYLEFVRHLDSNLPDYNMARCPLAGACLPSTLDSWAEAITNRSKGEGNPAPSLGEHGAAQVYQESAFRMRENRCYREEQLAQCTEILPDSVQEILRWFDAEALSNLGYELQKPTGRVLVPLALIEHDNCDYKYTIGVTPEEKDKPLLEISPVMFATFGLEAPLQQMICGDGPLCLCYPHQPTNCTYRLLLHWIWNHTEPDPKWHNNWKHPEKKPLCIE